MQKRISLARSWRLLRSRKLAIWLLLAAIVYSAVGISVPGIGREGFSSPIFLGIAALLGLSTAVCAWERSVRAVRAMREPEGVPSDVVDRLAKREPMLSVRGDIGEVRSDVRDALSGIGLKTRATADVVRGRAHRFGPLGSPLFHWALAVLFVVVPLGRLSRSEGQIGVPVGAEGVENVAASYGKLERGPLYLNGLDDVRVVVTELKKRARPDGIDLGLVPTVALVREGRVLAKSEVYRNHPLRYQGVLVHSEAWGYFGKFSLVSSSGQALGQTTALFDLEGQNVKPAVVELTAAGGSRIPVTVAPVLATSSETTKSAGRRVKLTWREEAGETTSAVLSIGRSQPLLGASLRFDEAGQYARLSLVDDWSVYPIYALLCLAIAGLAVAILAPRRTVWVRLDETDGVVAVRILPMHDRRDPAFALVVADALAGIGDSLKGELQ